MDFRLQNILRMLALAAVASPYAVAYAAAAPPSDLSKDYTWNPVRIGSGGFVRGMAVSPTDPNVRYARADVDNVYRWDATAKRWVPTKIASAFNPYITGAPTNGGGGAIAIDPNNPDKVLVAYTFTRSSDVSTSNPNINLNIYYSNDGARTFTPSNLSLSGSLSQETVGEHIAIDPNNSNLVYFGSPSNGLWRSFDGGVHFENVTSGGAPSATAAVALPKFDTACGTGKLLGQTVSKCVFLTLTNGSILHSKDGGKTWVNISAGQPVDGKPGFATIDARGDLLVADGSSQNIYKYTRAGLWSTITTPVSGITGIASDPSRAARIFVIGGGGALARTTNGGTTWTSLGSGLYFSETQPIEWLRPNPIRPQNHYFSNGGLYFDAAGRLFSPGGNDGVVSATPNDKTDTAANPPVWSAAPGIEELVATNSIIPPGGRPILAADDETLFTINDPDRFNADHYGIDLWAYNGTAGYNNNGLSSAQDITYAPNQPRYIAVASDNFFAGNPQTQQYSGYSDDAGYTWNLFPSILSGTNPCILYGGTIAVSARPRGNEGEASGSDNIVRLPAGSFSYGPNAPAPFYSFDGGKTWTQTKSFDTVTDPNGSAAQQQHPCQRSADTYTYMPNFWGDWVGALVQHSIVADPHAPGTFYLNLSAGGLWKSIDGGVTWTKPAGAASLPLYAHHGKLVADPNRKNRVWFVDGREGATAHGLYETSDGGVTFTRNKNFDFAWAIALGKEADGSNDSTVYIYGLMTGDGNWGVFQSTNAGKTFNRISYYPTGLFDYATNLSASWDTFGTVYMGLEGNGYVYSTYTPAQ